MVLLATKAKVTATFFVHWLFVSWVQLSETLCRGSFCIFIIKHRERCLNLVLQQICVGIARVILKFMHILASFICILFCGFFFFFGENGYL